MSGVLGALAGSGGTTYFVGYTTGNGSTTINLPAGLQQNDIVIIATTYSTTGTPPLPTGYTNGQSGNSGSSVGYRWSYKRMGATPDTTASGIDTVAPTVAMAFRGVNATTALDVTPPAVATGASGMPDSPSITTANSSIIVAIGYGGNGAWSSMTPPTNYNGAGSQSTFSGFPDFLIANLIGAWATVTGAVTADPGVFGGSGAPNWVGATIALRLA